MLRKAFDSFAGLSKLQMFLAILVVLAILGTGISLIARHTFVAEDKSRTVHVAIVGPMSGEGGAIGRALRQGAQMYVDGVNKAGGMNGVFLALDVYDDENNPEIAKQRAEEIAKSRALAVIGPWSNSAVLAASEAFRALRVPVLTPSVASPELTAGGNWQFTTVYNMRTEARFLANYARNVLGQRLLSVIHDNSDYGTTFLQAFEETYERFGTPVKYKYALTRRERLDADLKAIVADLAQRPDAGAIFLAVSDSMAPTVLKALKDGSIRTTFIAPSSVATRRFAQAFERFGREDGADYPNGLIAAAPLLFDTANEAAQNFQTQYQQAYGESPDWVAAHSYEAIRAIAATVKEAGLDGSVVEVAEKRLKVSEALQARSQPNPEHRGITGNLYFNQNGEAELPVLMGIYNGRNIVSALTQLQPISRGAVSNYIEELKQGRVLYVNDKFMYKTNVVYVGLKINEITDLDMDKETAVVDFSIWFRYRGNFAPEDIVFSNSVEPVKLDKPADEQTQNDMSYKLFRVKQAFSLNFSGAERSYGNHIVGVSFHHRTLNRNNLLYVVDVLGMPSGDALEDQLKDTKVLSENSGWKVERAWVAQEVSEQYAFGDPKYVGHGSIEPVFSKIDLGILIRKSSLTAKDLIAPEYFIYLFVFGALGSLFAMAMDAKKLGRYWAMQSFGLRAAFWPILLLASGNLVLDFAFQNLSLYTIRMLVAVYDALWWFVPARLTTMALARFLWIPIEERTQRKIPNVVRMFASFFIYAIATLGVIAFVFDQTITSLLATSGLLAMIIGLAIQANISNVFSGIVLNVERPFKVGDWVKIGQTEDGKVIDITWRTTRLLTHSGMSISIPNAKASEAQVVNYSELGGCRMTIPIFMDPDYPAARIREVLWDSPLDAPIVLKEPRPKIFFDGLVGVSGKWAARYVVQYWISDYENKAIAMGMVWDCIRSRLANAGISMNLHQVEDGETPEVVRNDEEHKDKELEEEIKENQLQDELQGRMDDEVVLTRQANS